MWITPCGFTTSGNNGPHAPTCTSAAHLSTAPFTVYEARAANLSAARLRASDFTPSGRLLYLPAAGTLKSAAWPVPVRRDAGRLDFAHHGRRPAGAVAPVLVSRCRELHLSKPKVLPPVRRKGVVGHTVLAFDDEVMVWDGIRISTPPGRGWTWPACCRLRT